MAYLIAGVEPIKDGHYVDSRAYQLLIEPIISKLNSAVFNAPDFDDEIPF